VIEPITLARPYARAAFQFAVDNGAVDSWHEALVTVAAVVAEPSVAKVLDDPATTASQRAQTVATVPGLKAEVEKVSVRTAIGHG